MFDKATFDSLIHADWSKDARKRWQASAERQNGTRLVEGPRRTPDSHVFMQQILRSKGEDRHVLVGFDFPIGLPSEYGEQSKSGCFPQFLLALGTGKWTQFFNVAHAPSEISLYRPFYPQVARRGVRLQHLLDGLAVVEANGLLRLGEHRTENRRAACSLFWTLGASQVGKAALTGWQEIVIPALRKGVRVWPFDGSLGQLSSEPGCVICETYPAEAYAHLGFSFAPGESKRCQNDRASRAPNILTWAKRNGVDFAAETERAVCEGFESNRFGEDQFDALVGLLGMIEVVDGRRQSCSSNDRRVGQWEGWILGQQECG